MYFRRRFVSSVKRALLGRMWAIFVIDSRVHVTRLKLSITIDFTRQPERGFTLGVFFLRRRRQSLTFWLISPLPAKICILEAFWWMQNLLKNFFGFFCEIFFSSAEIFSSKSAMTCEKSAWIHFSNENHDFSWFFMIFHDFSWFFMIFHTSEYFWVLLGASGCFWVLLGASGCFWVLLDAPGRSWTLLEMKIMKTHATGMCVFMIFRDVCFHDFSWFFHDFSWFFMFFHASEHFWMLLNASECFWTLLNASERSWTLLNASGREICMVIMVLALDGQGILGRKISDPDFSKKK